MIHYNSFWFIIRKCCRVMNLVIVANSIHFVGNAKFMFVWSSHLIGARTFEDNLFLNYRYIEVGRVEECSMGEETKARANGPTKSGASIL